MRQQVFVQWDPLNELFQSNFAMGRSTSNQRTVYMLDFGLARQFLNQVREEVKLRLIIVVKFLNGLRI